jgi:tetratricopeptide (TPR) repeat protein
MERNKENLPVYVKQGLLLFYQDQYYEAHEAFETAWRKTQDPAREFFRALIHISGGFLRLTQNRPKAAVKFFEHALKWLMLLPDTQLGFNITLLIKDLNFINAAIKQGEIESENIKRLLHSLDSKETRIS